MNDPKEIYLQPECCADPCIGRVWCEDDAPAECEDGNQWTRYVRADRYTELLAEIYRLQKRAAELEKGHEVLLDEIEVFKSSMDKSQREYEDLHIEHMENLNVMDNMKDDVRRYLWLRQYGKPEVVRGFLLGAYSADDVDRAIDTAMSKEPPK